MVVQSVASHASRMVSCLAITSPYDAVLQAGHCTKQTQGLLSTVGVGAAELAHGDIILKELCRLCYEETSMHAHVCTDPFTQIHIGLHML